MASHDNTQADEEVGKAAMFHGQPRRKGIGTRVWLVVAESGESWVEEFNKQSIMRRTGLPGRDLRILDPMLSYPSTILGRERAIVINLEHIKAIITAKEFLMLNSTNPFILRFVNLLKSRIFSFPVMPQKAKDGMVKENAVEASWSSSPAKSHQDTPLNTDKTSRNSTMEASGAAEPKVLPFEFRALEACLESACRCLESETRTLEQEAYPALDELTSQISTLNLERVRQIKSRLVAISGRVQKVRDELEHLLDDDHDMAEMHLAEKLGGGLMGQTLFREELNNEAAEADDERAEESKSEQNSEISTGFKPNIEELEMLLEAYFAQIDGISQKLFNMTEYVDNTEDFINIMLDDKQNHMLQMGVMLSTANMILNAGIGVVGVFGMNIHIALFDAKPLQFWQTTFGTIGGCVVLYLIAVGWGRKKNLL